MPATLFDMWNLSQDAVFQNRVHAALMCISMKVEGEGWDIPFHRERQQYVVNVLSSIQTSQGAAVLFANSASTDDAVINEATINGTVPIDDRNRADAAKRVTDESILAAVNKQFNSFVREPGI